MTHQGHTDKTSVVHNEDIKLGQTDFELAPHDETFEVSPEALGTNLPPNYYRSPLFMGTVMGLSLGYLTCAAGWVLSSNVLTLINADLGPSTNIAWVALSITLSLSVGFLLVGRLSDIFGRRWFMIVGNLLAVVGNVVAATAPSIGALIAANTLSGLASAAQISFTVAISELVPNKHRPLWVGGILFSAFPLIGFGPIISQELSHNTSKSWRWCFWLGFILATLSVILLFFCYFPPNFHMLHKRRTRIQQLQRVDFVGMALFMAGLILLLLGLNWGGTSYPWKSAHVIATIIIGFFTLILFVIYDNYVHKGDALLPIYLGYIAMTLTATVASSVYYGMSVLWPRQVVYLFNGSVVQNGFQQSVLGLGTAAGQGAGGLLVHYFRRHHRWILIASTISLTAFAAAMISVEFGDKAKGITLMLMASLSVGVIETASLSLAPLSCPPEDLGVALGTLGSIRSAGGSIGVAIYVTVLDNKLLTITPKKVTAAALAAGLPQSSIPELLGNPTNVSSVPGIDTYITLAVKRATSDAAAESFKFVWYAVTAFGVLSIIVSSLTVKNYDQFMTEDVARKLHGRKIDEIAGHIVNSTA